MADIRKKFGTRLRKLRREADLTQEQLASAADVSVDFLSLVERGINAPSFDNLEKIARALGVTVRELFDFRNQGGP
jgi:transcriptional regulator with XRE-family HTH domain